MEKSFFFFFFWFPSNFRWSVVCHFSSEKSAVALLILMKTFDWMTSTKCQRPILVFHEIHVFHETA